MRSLIPFYADGTESEGRRSFLGTRNIIETFFCLRNIDYIARAVIALVGQVEAKEALLLTVISYFVIEFPTWFAVKTVLLFGCVDTTVASLVYNGEFNEYRVAFFTNIDVVYNMVLAQVIITVMSVFHLQREFLLGFDYFD